MEFHVVRTNGVPPYRQFVQQIKAAIRSGALRPGDRLPTASDAAVAAAVGRNTVLRAYRELALEGIAVVHPRRGTSIARALRQLTPHEQDVLARRLERWVVAARGPGLDDQGIAEVLNTTLRRAQTARVRAEVRAGL